jgi:hypothetical protein
LKAQGTTPSLQGLNEFGAGLDAERSTWYRMIKDNGIKVE